MLQPMSMQTSYTLYSYHGRINNPALQSAFIVVHVSFCLAEQLCYVQGARNEIFALQPAPVQTSYMGFPATMGASFLPYLITDKVVAPESCRHCYSENLALMPNCYFVNDYKHAHMVRHPHH